MISLISLWTLESSWPRQFTLFWIQTISRSHSFDFCYQKFIDSWTELIIPCDYSNLLLSQFLDYSIDLLQLYNSLNQFSLSLRQKIARSLSSYSYLITYLRCLCQFFSQLSYFSSSSMQFLVATTSCSRLRQRSLKLIYSSLIYQPIIVNDLRFLFNKSISTLSSCVTLREWSFRDLCQAQPLVLSSFSFCSFLQSLLQLSWSEMYFQ